MYGVTWLAAVVLGALAVLNALADAPMPAIIDAVGGGWCIGIAMHFQAKVGWREERKNSEAKIKRLTEELQDHGTTRIIVHTSAGGYALWGTPEAADAIRAHLDEYESFKDEFDIRQEITGVECPECGAVNEFEHNDYICKVCRNARS